MGFVLVFTKLMKPLIKILRLKGFIIVIYLDDILVIAEWYERCLENTKIIVEMLQKLGFIVNFEKCNLKPITKGKFLDMMIN